jgi:hypothetical protein
VQGCHPLQTSEDSSPDHTVREHFLEKFGICLLHTLDLVREIVWEREDEGD